MGSGKMAFAVDRQVLLVLVITAEFLSVFFFFFFFFFFFTAKRLFLLRKLDYIEDVETLLQRNSFPF